jgi:hypothetical protein
MQKEIKYSIPTLTSRFPFESHPDKQAMWDHTQPIMDQVSEALTEKDVDPLGSFVDTGVTYAALMYPGADLERAKSFCVFFSAWPAIDDVADNTLDRNRFNDIFDRLSEAAHGKATFDPLFRMVREFFRLPEWHPDALRLNRQHFQHFIDGARTLREVEVARAPLPLEEYLDQRALACGVPASYMFIAWMIPSLTDEICAIANSEIFQRIQRASGAACGVCADLAMRYGRRQEIVNYARTEWMIQSQNPAMDGQQAIDAAVSLFHELEAQLDADFATLSKSNAELGRALMYMHSGVIASINELKRNRYSTYN